MKSKQHVKPTSILMRDIPLSYHNVGGLIKLLDLPHNNLLFIKIFLIHQPRTVLEIKGIERDLPHLVQNYSPKVASRRKQMPSTQRPP